MPTHVQFLVVLKSQKDRKKPLQNGYKKPMQNAAKVGSRNSQKHLWIGRRISGELSAVMSRFFWNSFIAGFHTPFSVSLSQQSLQAHTPTPGGGVSSGLSFFLETGASAVLAPVLLQLFGFFANAPIGTFRPKVPVRAVCYQAFSLAYWVAQPSTKAVSTALHSPVPETYWVKASTTPARQSSTAGV